MIPEHLRSDAPYLAACEVLATLQQAGHPAYLVGGCVRDLLLGLPPHDWDVVTSALPDEIETLFPQSLPVGKSFGVITVVKGDLQTQVATFRQDGAYQDHRRPDAVQFHGGVEQDVRRRDFTINGILYDPLHEQLLDRVEGGRDLNLRFIRAIGDPFERFEEDPLRMLRALRFATTLNFIIEPQTLQAIHAMGAAIQNVSWERIREEIEKILVSPRRVQGVRLLDTLGLLPLILPEIRALQGVEQPPEFHPEGDVFVHTMLCLDRLPRPTFPQALATLLHDIGKPATFTNTDRIRFNGHAEVGAELALAICQRLKLSSAETDEVVWIVANHMKIKEAPQMRRSRLRRFMSEQHFPSLRVVARADSEASGGSREHLAFLDEQLQTYQREPLRPAPLLRGQDLLDLKIPPGPIYRQILHQVEDAQLEGRVTSHPEALALARQLLGHEKP